MALIGVLAGADEPLGDKGVDHGQGGLAQADFALLPILYGLAGLADIGDGHHRGEDLDRFLTGGGRIRAGHLGQLQVGVGGGNFPFHLWGVRRRSRSRVGRVARDELFIGRLGGLHLGHRVDDFVLYFSPGRVGRVHGGGFGLQIDDILFGLGQG